MNPMTILEVKIEHARSFVFHLIDRMTDNLDQASSQITNKRRGSVAADFAPPRPIVSERRQMAVLKQLIAGDESNSKEELFLSVVDENFCNDNIHG